MARLKVKQISDFDSKVNSLITAGTTDEAASIDSLESLASSNFATVSDALSTEIDATSTDVKTLSDALSVEILATSGDVKVLSDALSTEILATSGDVSSIDLVLGAAATDADLDTVSNALSTEISSTNSDVVRIDDLLASVATDGELSSEVASIDTRITNSEGDVTAVSNAVSAILAGSDADSDQFAEVISYVDSLDTADGGALTSALASINTAISNNNSLDVVLSDALSTEIAATSGDVSSIDLVLGTMGTSETITAISNAVSAEISATNSDVTSIDTVIGELGNTYATDVELSSAVSVEKLRAETAESALAQADEYVHQIGTFRSATSFAITGVRFAAKEDLLVFINGHNIHPLVGESGDGWSTVDGVNFTLTNIGYDLEADDHVYVTGVEL